MLNIEPKRAKGIQKFLLQEIKRKTNYLQSLLSF